MSYTPANTGEQLLPRSVSPTTSPLRDSAHPDSMSDDDIDVVGDSPSTEPAAKSANLGVSANSSSQVDSGVYADVSSLARSFHSQNDLSGRAAAATSQYDSGLGSSLHRLPTSADDRTHPNLPIPTTNQQTKSMHSATPMVPVIPHWFPPLPPVPFMPLFQPSAFTYLPGFSSQAHYSVQPPHPVFSQYAQGTVSSAVPHPAFNYLGFPTQTPAPSSSGSRATGSHLYTSPLFNSPLFMDQPLNLSNRRPYQASAVDTNTPHHSGYSPMSSPAIVPLVSPSPNLYHMTSTPTGKYPMSRTHGNHFAGDTGSSQNVPIFSSTPNLPGSSYTFLPLRVPQEGPLNMSTVANRPKHKSADCENVDGESENKRCRLTKKSKKVSKRLDLTSALTTSKIEAKVECTENSQPSTRVSPDQLVRGVTLAMPPSSWRPISHLMKAKEKCGDNDRKTSRALKSKENIADGDDTAKQRNKPELFGDMEITELTVIFYDCPERGRFCDGNFKFQVPKIPDSSEGQAELREALMRLFANSNLPPVPSALQHSAHALSQYPFMQHIFNLHMQGVNLDNLKFGAYGLAFENIRLVELGEQTFNDILDRMSYLGDDDLLHCLVKSEKSGAVCGHVAKEIGKIRRHSKNHYPDKKWVCVFCRVQMCDMTDLERHTATHTELKPFECPHCAKKFCQKVTLTQHMHKTHGQQLAKWDAKSSYICRQDGCSYSQGDEVACVRHLKQHHGQSDYLKRKNQNKWPFNVLSADAVKNLDVEA